MHEVARRRIRFDRPGSGLQAQRFKDGTFILHFRADAGSDDQGGGPVWRVQDENNYYVCRANPLENNFRLYVVTAGVRKQLASVEANLARGFKAAIDAVKAVRAKNAVPASKFDDPQVPTTNAITAAKLDAVFFADGTSKGAAKDGMYKVTIGRTAEMSCGCLIGSQMGINTWAGFCGNDDSAAVAGDFITFKGELQPVLHALRQAGINVVSIHNHMESESSPSIFLHYWGKGRAENLARGVKSALDAESAATSK